MLAVTDLSHEFTFFFDGRLADRYLAPCGIDDARNWGTLHKYDLRGIGLLVVQSGATPCPYLTEDIAAAERFLLEGGAVLVLGEYAQFRSEVGYRLNDFVQHFGAEFLDEAARSGLVAMVCGDPERIETFGSKCIRLYDPSKWEILVRDADGEVVSARRTVGLGEIVIASRNTIGHNPDTPDNINAAFWFSVLKRIVVKANGSQIGTPRHELPELVTERGGLPIQHSVYLQPWAECVFEVYAEVCPSIEALLGVPRSLGQLTRLILLPTGSGGFSSGNAIGIGVWWGNFPDKRYEMIELVSHEAVHSWVLPHSEPMWNEAIATYVGILVGRGCGYETEPEEALYSWIAGAQRLDPRWKRYDLTAVDGIPQEVRMGKPMWIWEDLRRECPDILARYFRAKRHIVQSCGLESYSAHDAVAVLSSAIGRNLFSWFCDLGTRVDESSTSAF